MFDRLVIYFSVPQHGFGTLNESINKPLSIADAIERVNKNQKENLNSTHKEKDIFVSVESVV